MKLWLLTVIWVGNSILTFVVFPFFFVIGFLVVLGSLLRFSSASWFGVWGGLELNIMCFLPMVMHFSNFLGVESVVKYFLIQSFGSVGVLFGGLFEDSFFFGFVNLFFVLCFRLFLKVGVFPFHWWLPGVLSGFSWFGVLVLSTWQKVAPVFIFSHVRSGRLLLLTFAVLSSFIGGLGGVGQTRIRSILAFSSIGHAGWFFSLFCVSWFFGLVYFFIYLFRTLFVVLFFWIVDYSRVSQRIVFSFFGCILFFFCILTISGVPPFLGFFAKIFGFLAFGFSFVRLFFFMFLLLGSLIRLYFYLGLFFSCFFFFYSFVGFRWVRFSYFFIRFLVFSLFGYFFIDYFFIFFYDILV